MLQASHRLCSMTQVSKLRDKRKKEKKEREEERKNFKEISDSHLENQTPATVRELQARLDHS